MTLSPKQIGDKGQRYQCEYLDDEDYAAMSRGEPYHHKIIGWAVDHADAVSMCAAWEMRPSVTETRFIDREPWTHGELVVIDDGPGKPIYITSFEAGSGDIADLYHIVTANGKIYRKKNAVADAARIVKTWNAHDDLVRELTNFVNAVATGAITTSEDETLANVTTRSRKLLDKLKT